MTDPLPDPELDELIAAYLDGEANPDERARVQTDPDLLARAETLRAIANLVAEPVAPPDHALRDAQIDAALAASSTSAVVTSMPSRRDRSDLLRVVSIAAVVLAIMVAVPVLFLTGDGNDDDAATSATSADDSVAAMDAVGENGGADGAAELAVEDEGAVRSTDDGEAPAAEEASGSAPAEEMAEADMADSFDDEPFDEESVAANLDGVPRIDLGDTATTRALRRQVERRLAEIAPGADEESGGGGDASSLPDAESSADLVCGAAIAAETSAAGPALAVGSTVFDGVVSEYVIIDQGVSVLVVIEAATCEVLLVD